VLRHIDKRSDMQFIANLFDRIAPEIPLSFSVSATIVRTLGRADEYTALPRWALGSNCPIGGCALLRLMDSKKGNGNSRLITNVDR
jgi:hypothetical protein